MRTALQRLLLPVLVLGSLATATVRGGPLDPPAAPAPTDGVRGPGTPISSLPYSITQSGYYYVTRPLLGVSGNGISISASNVTLDLGGFTLNGNGSAGAGVATSGGVRNVTVRNGAVRGWGASGIDFSGSTQSLVEHIHSSSNTFTGIRISVHSEVRNCNASLNGANGIYVTKGVVRDSVVTENQVGIQAENSSVIRNVFVSSNSNYGVYIQFSGNSVLDSDFVPGGAGYVTDIAFQAGAGGNIAQGNRLCTTVTPGPANIAVDNVTRSGC